MAALSPIPALEDLKITFHNHSIVFPSEDTQKKSIFLSNIDQILNYNILTAHFFKPNPDFSPQNVAGKLKTALEKVLVPYDFMAGRLELNVETGRLEINCNAAGAGFVVASSEFSLDEIGDYLVHPNIGYRQLAAEKLDILVDQPLCIFQITSFTCGGFAIGMSTNHVILDGLAAKAFLENLASQAFDNTLPLAAIPCNDRRLLAARSPPQVAFPHHEYLDLNLPNGQGTRPPVYDCDREELNFKIFKLSSTDIANLKHKARSSDAHENAKITTFGVTAALMWRCKAFSGNTAGHTKDKLSTLLNSVNIRARVNPQLPHSYSGNGVLPIGVSATYEELERGPFSRLVELIATRPNDMTDEYVKSAFDWLEVYGGIPHGDYLAASWLGLGFEQVGYPWGKPVYCCPIVNHRKDICWIFRDATDEGVGAMVALPAQEMDRFEEHFYDFLTMI